jgi:polar amino acid transport system substrate-binding protein
MSIRLALTSSALAVTLLAGVAGVAGDRSGGPQPAAASGPAVAERSAAERPAADHPARVPAPGAAAGAQDCTEGETGNVRQSLRPRGPLPPPGQMTPGSTMADIAQRGRLVVGVDQDTYLFAFRDPGLELRGFDIDVIHDISEAIFGAPDRVTYRPLDVVDRVEAVNGADPVDLVVATMTVTCERRERVAFSTVYFKTGQKVLVNRGSGTRDLAGLGGQRVCAARGSTSLVNVLVHPAKPIGVGVASTTDCLVLLQLGEVDAISTDAALLAGLKAQDPRTEIVGAPFSAEPYAIAINSGKTDLVRFVNAVLAQRVADGRWDESYDLWLREPLQEPPAPPVPEYLD